MYCPRVDHLRDPQIHTEAGQHVGVRPRELVLLGEVVDHRANCVLGRDVQVRAPLASHVKWTLSSGNSCVVAISSSFADG